MFLRRIVSILFVTLLLASLSALAEEDCSATVSATLDRQEGRQLQFSAELSTGASCASIEYDLVVEVQLPNAQVKRIRKPRFVKLNDGSLTEIVRHTLADGESMLSYEAKVVKCSKCDLGA